MREQYLNRLYEILGLLQQKEFNNGFHYLENLVPARFIQSGLYFFFDSNIPRNNGGNKIVRIGKTGNNNNPRLNHHRNGNINNSIFRRHVMNALERNHQVFDANAINESIHPLPYLFLPIPHQNNLETLEERMIELVSNRHQPIQIDTPPPNWLGYHASNHAISESHLWNVQLVGNYNPDNEIIYIAALELLTEYVDTVDNFA